MYLCICLINTYNHGDVYYIALFLLTVPLATPVGNDL